MRYEDLGPVWNPDGTPTEMTKDMLAGTGREEEFAMATVIVTLPQGGLCDGENWRTHHVIHSFSLRTTAMVCTECGNVCDIDNNVVRAATEEDLARPPDADEWDAKFAAYRAELAALEAAGTPYWCTHEGREVDHPAAYWKEDGYERKDKAKVHWKHGVMCRDCGGYIQEG